MSGLRYGDPGPGPPPASGSGAGGGWRRVRVVLLVLAALLIVAPTVFYVVGYLAADPSQGTCRLWASCTGSARTDWHDQHGTAPGWGAFAGTTLAALVLLWGPLREHPKARGVIGVLALLVLLPVTALSVFSAWLALTTTCDPNALFCFDGPEAAGVFITPGLIAGAVAAVIVYALVQRQARWGMICSTFVSTLVAAFTAGCLAAGVFAGMASSMNGY